jgi:hypothetical protein
MLFAVANRIFPGSVLTTGEAGLMFPTPITSQWVRKLVLRGDLPGFRTARGQFLVLESDVRQLIARRQHAGEQPSSTRDVETTNE